MITNDMIGLDFYRFLSNCIYENIDNDYQDNFDPARFGEKESITIDRKSQLEFFLKNIEKFKMAFDTYFDNNSKQLFLLLIAYKLLGHRKVKLPLSIPMYWDLRKQLVSIVDSGNDFITESVFGWKLYKADLTNIINLPVKLYTSGIGILIDFVLKQYEYLTENNIHIGAKKGDVVIDGGACWGDTALYFANLVGETGKVFSFEFTQENLSIFNKNVELNPSLKDRIELVDKALWNVSDQTLNFNSHGPGTTINKTDSNSNESSVKSISIDDLVERYNIPKVDFIKMDIEGSETMALKGAINTIKRFKPQMAITVYHGMSDFIDVPLMINNLNLGYKLYLNHFTIYHEETVLFATV